MRRDHSTPIVLRWLATFVVVSLLVMLFADVAEAQRRRRPRRRATPAPTEQVEAPPDGEPADASPAQDDSPPPSAAASEESSDPAPPTAAPPAVEPVDDFEPPPDLSPLREEYTALMDELVQVRSRIAVVGRQLFQTKIRVFVHDRAGDDVTLGVVSIHVDGAPVYRVDGAEVGALAEGTRTSVFEGFAAPGPHEVTVEVEQRSRADEEYRYTLRDTFRFQVVRDKLTEVTVVLDDDSDIAQDFEDDGEGEYDVRTRLRVATRELGED